MKTRRQKLWTICCAVFNTQDTFTIEDIAVAAFQQMPKDFSMRGHAYPDTRKISVLLSGPYSMLKSGMLISLGKGKYRVNTMLNTLKEEPRPTLSLPSDQRWLEDFLNSDFARKSSDRRTRIDAMRALQVSRLSDIYKALDTYTRRLERLDSDGVVEEGKINQARALLNIATGMWSPSLLNRSTK